VQVKAARKHVGETHPFNAHLTGVDCKAENLSKTSSCLVL